MFGGDAVLELYLTRPVSERIRPTDDTDVICEVSGRAGYRLMGGTPVNP